MIFFIPILFIILIIFIYWASTGGNQNIRNMIEKYAEIIYYYIKIPFNLRFFKYEDLYVSKHEILNGIPIKYLRYKKINERDYIVCKMRIMSIGLYEKIDAPVMEYKDFLKGIEDGHFIKCDNLDKTIKSLTSINKFNL